MGVNYNDGKWHGWNGGEIPVDPLTEVQAIFSDKSGCKDGESMPAELIVWDNVNICPCAFRVIREHREPLEFWVDYDNDRIMKYCEDTDGSFKEFGYVHVREVLE